MIDSGLHGYNASTVATAACLVAVRGAGSGSAASDAVGTAVAGLLKTGGRGRAQRLALASSTCLDWLRALPAVTNRPRPSPSTCAAAAAAGTAWHVPARPPPPVLHLSCPPPLRRLCATPRPPPPTEAPIITWEQDGTAHAALVFMNFTSASPLGDARAACRTVQAGLPSKLRRGASVTTSTFTYLFDPRAPGKKGEFQAAVGSSSVASCRRALDVTPALQGAHAA